MNEVMSKYVEPTWDSNEQEYEAFIKSLAPIALFAYNRLDHLQRTVNALKKNIYAQNSILICFSDGARTPADEGNVSAVRAYLHEVDGFLDVRVIEREKNMGLADNIIDGVTSTVNRYGKIIVLEDDLITSRYFLKYMNDALRIYEDDEQVMEIAGHVPFYETEGLPETLFSRFATCWGWGTWKRSWAYFHREPEKLRDSFSDEEKREFCLDGYYNSWRPILRNCDGSLKSWAIFWIAAIFKNQGLCLNPSRSLVNNIGTDGSGVDNFFNIYTSVDISDEPVRRFTREFKENVLAKDYRKQAALSSIPQGILMDEEFDYIEMEEDYLSLLRGKEVIVFGAAQVGRTVRELLEKSEVHVSAFCDNDAGKQGNIMEGLPVISLQTLLEKESTSYYVVVALQYPYAEAVKAQLLANGVFNYIDFTQIDFPYGVDFYTPQFIIWQAEQEKKRAELFQEIFAKYVNSGDVVAEIGAKCGFLLKRMRGRKLIGVEDRACAVRYGRRVNKIEYVSSISKIQSNTLDVAISAYVLEEMESPLQALQDLRRCLKPGGQAVFIVSCDNDGTLYKKGSKNIRLYTWNQLALGNLFKRAGYHVTAIKTGNLIKGENISHLIIARK